MKPATGSLFTAIIEREDNLKEALELFLETADPKEIQERRREQVFVTQLQAMHG